MDFAPRLDILPPSQRRLWDELADVPREFVLYGKMSAGVVKLLEVYFGEQSFAKDMVTLMPFPGDDVTATSADVFCFSDWTMIAPSFPGFGQTAPSGRPTPSSAMTMWHP
jgi:hypothetical protein